MDQKFTNTFSLRGRCGRRKYLTPDERMRFIETARAWPDCRVGTLCLMLAYSGCRISEALAMTDRSIDLRDECVVIRSLKKRGRLIFRSVPLPSDILQLLIPNCSPAAGTSLWPVSRTQAWLRVKDVMRAAGVQPGPHATPKGLRHAFGIHALRCGAPLNLVQRWLGHASMATTAIYAQAMGLEERTFAAQMW